MIRGIILLGGPTKKANYGVYEQASPLFPIAGSEIISHIVHTIQKLKNLKDIVLLGYYDQAHFKIIQEKIQKQYGRQVSYIQETSENGTGGGIAKYLDMLFDVDDLLVVHSDITCDFSAQEFYEFHKSKNAACSMVTIKVSKEESLKYGCFIKNAQTDQMVHHAEKPEAYISDLVNTGIYLFNREFQTIIKQARLAKIQQIIEQQPCLKMIKKGTELNQDYLSIEKDVLKLAERNSIYLYQINSFWQPIKNTTDVLKANQLLLRFYDSHPLFYATSEYEQRENFVLVHKTAKISPLAKLGPYVVIGAGCDISDGVRIQNSIIQDGVVIKNFSIIINSIICYNCIIGYWCRVEGGDRVTFLGPCSEIDSELFVRNVICFQNKKILQNCESEYIM